MSTRFTATVTSVAVLGLLASANALAQTNPNQDPPYHAIVPIKDNLYQFQHNIWLATFVVTDAGIILMDPINEKAATWFKAEAKRRFNQDVRYLIYSHAHYDHAEGGAVFDRATVIGQENIVAEFADQKVKARAPDITYRNHMTLKLGGDAVELYHFGDDHGRSMTYLYHPRTRAVTTVDMAARARLPYRDLPYDDPQATIDTLKKLVAMDIDYVLPGHGNVGNKQDLVKLIGYWELLRSAVQTQRTAGKSVDETKAAVTPIMAQYSEWQLFKEWLPFNIEAMYRILGAAN